MKREYVLQEGEGFNEFQDRSRALNLFNRSLSRHYREAIRHYFNGELSEARKEYLIVCSLTDKVLPLFGEDSSIADNAVIRRRDLARRLEIKG